MSTETPAKPAIFDHILKVLTPLLTLITVIVGVYQFNKGQKENKEKEFNIRKLETEKMNNQLNREILSKFKENQNKIYSEAMDVIGFLATNTDYQTKEYQEKLNRFNQLYWVGLSFVATKEVETELLKFQTILKNLQVNDYRNIDDKLFDLQEAAESIANAMKNSSMDYTLPGGLRGLEIPADSTK